MYSITKMDSYDEVHDVQNVRNIETPPDNCVDVDLDLDVSSAIRFIQSEDDEKDDDKNSISNETSHQQQKHQQQQQQRHKPKLEKVDSQQGKTKPFRKLNIDSIEDTVNNHSSDSSSKSDDDDDDDDDDDGTHQYLKSHPSESIGGGNGEKHLPPKFEINLKQFENLDASFPAELKEIMQYVPKYAPQNIDIDYKLQVFIPEFIPSVGDTDCLLKVLIPKPLNTATTTDKEQLNDISRLGLNVLDEPAEQSDEALLQIKLRSIFAKPLAAPSAIVKTPKDIDKWIQEITSLHANRIHENFMQQQQTQINIDNLMSEWPSAVERKLEACYPSSHLDCTLSEYVRIICNLVDIPIDNVENHYDYIKALNVFFSLYIAVRNEK